MKDTQSGRKPPSFGVYNIKRARKSKNLLKLFIAIKKKHNLF